MSATIRRATRADSEQAAEVVRSVFEEYRFTWDDSDYFADLLDLESHYPDGFWVAELDGKIVGTVGIDLYELLPGRVGDLHLDETHTRAAGTDCSLERLYVHPSARRQGLGFALTEEVIKRAKELNQNAMEIWSDKRFGDAHRLYGRFGAKLVGDRICDDPDLSPEWGLAVDLKDPAQGNAV